MKPQSVPVGALLCEDRTHRYMCKRCSVGHREVHNGHQSRPLAKVAQCRKKQEPLASEQSRYCGVLHMLLPPFTEQYSYYTFLSIH